jgi:hypothetical protein
MVAQPSCHRLPSVKFHTSLEVATAHGLFRTLHKSTTGSRTILAPPGLAPLVLLSPVQPAATSGAAAEAPKTWVVLRVACALRPDQ